MSDCDSSEGNERSEAQSEYNGEVFSILFSVVANYNITILRSWDRALIFYTRSPVTKNKSKPSLAHSYVQSSPIAESTNFSAF